MMIVLGLLAVLLITAVTFSILMRIERAGSSNFRHGTTARHMLQAGLARAIEDIHNEAGRDLYPRFTRPIPGDPLYADHVLPSLDSATSTPVEARILSVEAMEYIPAIFHDAVKNSKPHWLPILAGPAGENRLVGRVAYIVVNTSGLLDANRVGRTNRWMGASVDEIQVRPELLSEVLDPIEFATNRNADRRYETMPELRHLNAWINPETLSHFGIYARPPRVADLNPDGEPKVYIGGNRADLLSRRAQIIEALIQAGIPDDDSMYGNLAEHAFWGLLGYVDNSTPNLGRPTTAAVPMIQSFAVRLNYTYDEDTRAGTCNFAFEAVLTLPFVGMAAGADIDVSLEVAIQNLNTHPDHEVMIPEAPAPEVITINNFTSFGRSPTLRANTSFVLPGNDPPNLGFEVRMTAVVTQTQGGTIVNRVEGLVLRVEDPENRGRPLTLQTASERGNDVDYWAETLDPRFNWDPGARWQWITSDLLRNMPSARPGANPRYTPEYNPSGENSLVRFLFENPAVVANPHQGGMFLPFDGMRMGSGDFDHPVQQGWMYSANRPLRSLGELGFLPIAPWTTIALYDKQHNETWGTIPADGIHRVLDYFTLDDPDDLGPPPRRLNINTPIPNVLESVYVDMPLREWLSPPPRLRLPGSVTAAQLRAFGDHFRSMQPFERLSDIGKVWRDIPNLQTPLTTSPLYALSAPLSTQQPPYLAGICEMDREAVIRNAIQLFSVRDQNFIIILRADAFVPSFGHTGIEQGSVLATGHAVAEIWRDAMPRTVGNTERHPTQLRLFMPIGR